MYIYTHTHTHTQTNCMVHAVKSNPLKSQNFILEKKNYWHEIKPMDYKRQLLKEQHFYSKSFTILTDMQKSPL